MRCFVCAGTHSSKLFEFEFECCTVRLGDSPRKPFHSLTSPFQRSPSPSPRRPSSFLPRLRVLLSTGRLLFSPSFFILFSSSPLSLHTYTHTHSFFLSFSRSHALSLCRIRFLEPPSLNPNPKVRRSAAFLGFDSCYRAKLPPQ